MNYSYIILFFASILDFACTKILYDKEGADIELNPWLHQMLVSTGTIWSIIVVKLALLAILGLGIYLERKILGKTIKIFLDGAVVFQVIVASYGLYLVL